MTETDRVGSWQPSVLAAGSVVYHYCNPAGLYGILDKQELWATEATGLNDLSELAHGRKTVAELLKEEPDSSDPRSLVHDLLDIATNGTLAQEERATTFLLCASLDGDDAGQWRLYGGPRAGYSLHLSADVQLRIVRGQPAPPAADPVSRREDGRIVLDFSTLADDVTSFPWHKVAYTKDECRALVRDLISWARRRAIDRDAAVAREQADLPSGATYDDWSAATAEHRDEFQFDLQSAVARASALIKPEGFRGEREVRVVAIAPWGDDHAKIRPNEFGLVRYLRLSALADPEAQAAAPPLIDEKSDRRLPVTGLTVGPTPYFEGTVPALRALLDRRGVAGPIHKSKVELRL